MVNQLSTHEQARYREYYESVFEIYKNVAAFTVFPNVYDIYGNYCTMVDNRILAVQVGVYGDDIYDGNPNKKYIPKGTIPDYMIGSLQDYIGMPTDITIDIIIAILEDNQMFYVHENNYYNSPLKEVW